MKQVISFSGGRTSAYLVYLMEQKRINEGLDVEYIFMDTGAEHEKTYEFIKRLIKDWGINLTCIRAVTNPKLGVGNTYKIISLNELKPDLQPWIEMTKKYGTPYVGGGEFCTDRMKTTPYKKYCDDTFGKDNYITWIGMRADEPKRLKKKKNIKYLAEISDFEKDDILKWWGEQNFDLEIEEHLGNCVFCIKKSINKIALATKDERFDAIKFYTMLNRNDVRVLKTRTAPSAMMYRGKNTLMQIISFYQDIPRDVIAATLRKSKRYESGSCSESCEVFNNYQMDIFKEEK